MSKRVTYKGRILDMEMVRHEGQFNVALGNMNVNARGDVLGKGGVIIKTREECLEEAERNQETPDFLPVHQSESLLPEMDFIQDILTDEKTDEEVEEDIEVEVVKPRKKVKKESDTDEQ